MRVSILRMGTIPKTAYLCLIIFISISSLAFAWTQPRQLTNNLTIFDPQIVAHGRELDVIGWPYLGYDFYFFRSWNNGFGWSDPIQPADTFYGGSDNPDIEYTSDGLIHVVWVGRPSPNARPQIYHQASSDGGRHWTNRHQVFMGNEYYLYYPRLSSKGDTLFLACRNLENLLVFRSFDSGITWRDSSAADIADNMDSPPTILYSQGRLHLVYELNIPNGGYKIYYSRSDDLGLTWSPRIYLSSYEPGPPFYDSQLPSAYADENGHIVAAWFDYQYGSMCGTTGDILARVSTDNGDSWLREARLTYTQSGNTSSCLILNDIIYVAWRDGYPLGCDHPKIVLSSSTNWGISWNPSEVISGDGPIYGFENAPFLLYSLEGSDTLIHCFYDINDSSGTASICYIRNKPFISNRAPLPGNQPIVLDIKASPNVFSLSTLISVDNSEGGNAELEIYNILGQRIWTKSLNGKEGQILWNAKDMNGNGVSSGTYIIRATSKETQATERLLYLK